MIKETELRIGNYVYCKGIIDKVLTVGHNDFYTEKYYHGIVNEDLGLIPLTEEILLKCGFKVLVDSDNKKYFRLKCDNYFASYTITFENGLFVLSDSESWDILTLTSLHQLQNLYFAYSGEELIRNL